MKIDKTIRYLGTAIVIILIILFFIILSSELDNIAVEEMIAKFGLLGLFLSLFIGSATVFSTAPNIPFILIACKVLNYNPFWIAIISGFGWSGGEITSYILGRMGVSVDIPEKYRKKKQKLEIKLADSMWKIIISIFISSAIPNPAFDVVPLTAGSLKVPILNFYLPCLFGRIFTSFLLVYFSQSIISYFNFI